jgi:hypothetical protein
MGNLARTFALVLVIFLTFLSTAEPSTVKAQSTTTISAPAIVWQQEYGDHRTESVSNLIQTSDGGYAFLDLGWSHGFNLWPSVFYKVDSSGNVQWVKSIEYSTAISLIQTSDKGYEISGNWNTYGTTYETTPTLIKTDSQGNIQWAQNYTSEPPNLSNAVSIMQTSDGGFASSGNGTITKTDLSGSIQWKKI